MLDIVVKPPTQFCAHVVSDISNYPEKITTKEKVIVLDTHKNLEWLLKQFRGKVCFNLMNRRREIIIPGMYVFKDDSENDCLSRIEYLATINGMPNKQIDKHLDVLAGENTYHPIVECISSKAWDGIARLDEFISTIKTTNPVIDTILIKTWMIAAIAAAHSEEGFINHGVLVIQGEQGIGKTAWVNSLDPCNSKAIKCGVLLDPKDKDSVIGASRFWIVEIGELDATFNKSDIAHLKSFITSPVDDVRVPWGRKETALVRRTAYIATVNENNFLVDANGNRRWWTVTAESINYEHNMDMQQVWSEVYHIWRKGGLPYLPPHLQSEVNIKNKDHEKIDPIRERLLTAYDWSLNHRDEFTVTEILNQLNYKNPTMAELVRAGKILTEINGKGGRKTNGIKLHSVPPKKFLPSF